MIKLAICWIGIGIYKTFFNDFYNSCKKYFCINCDKTFFIFTDDKEYFKNNGDCLIYEISNPCLDKDFILFRKFKYLLMAEDKYIDYDLIIFMNANIICKSIITIDDIFNNNKKISCINSAVNKIQQKKLICNIKSNASFIPQNWIYKQGGFFISYPKFFLKMALQIEIWRMDDKINNADKYVHWHDETYLNKFLYKNKKDIFCLDGKIYLCPNDMITKQTKIYTINKSKKFSIDNIEFPETHHKDLYQL